MARAEIIGSWFPSGYYGHVRNKPRNDFICEFRQLARPQPPKKFIKRAQCKPTVHVFSVHDNKSAFISDALYFERGLGRRRDPQRAYSFNPNFISWLPRGRGTDNQKDGPVVSTYRLNFQEGQPGKSVPQIMTKRPKTSFEGVGTTSYRYAYGNSQPYKDEINSMNKDALFLTYQQRQTPKLRPDGRNSVATCMTWHVPEPPKNNRVPMATQTTDFSATQTCKSTPSSSVSCISASSSAEKCSAPISWPSPPPMTVE